MHGVVKPNNRKLPLLILVSSTKRKRTVKDVKTRELETDRERYSAGRDSKTRRWIAVQEIMNSTPSAYFLSVSKKGTQ
jgi:hypothetical protein